MSDINIESVTMIFCIIQYSVKEFHVFFKNGVLKAKKKHINTFARNAYIVVVSFLKEAVTRYIGILAVIRLKKNYTLLKS